MDDFFSFHPLNPLSKEMVTTPMKLTRDDVVHIAALAHLDLGEAELTLYQEQLSAILDYAARLQALDTDAIPPTASVLPLRTVLRDDEPASTLPTEDALANAPAAHDNCFVVPPVR
jgi:aspartyl-tRNA(Asn)/glutamyl-tRNA(Gln) amidotransferase subunit C